MERPHDGIHAMVPREKMCESARKLRDIYAITPGVPFLRAEFGYYSLDRWKEQGMPQDVSKEELFNLDPPAKHMLLLSQGRDTDFEPAYEERVIEDRGEHELVQDHWGRHVLCFKGRRSGFMPTYLNHPVKDMKTWQEDVKWRLNSASPERLANLEPYMEKARAAAARGLFIQELTDGGYMFLRYLIGPEKLLYAFYDMPEVVHDAMKAWLDLNDGIIGRHQQYVTLDELCLGEDICYKSGSLICPDMIREFLLPYYQQLIANVRARQIDRTRHLHIMVDTDGYAESVIPLYQETGMDAMSPFEVASGCDVVRVGRRYPNLVILGGIDKRVLADSKEAIDRHLEYILPTMRARGGYVPTCDHGVPEEVPYENYLHYRRRCVELGG